MNLEQLVYLLEKTTAAGCLETAYFLMVGYQNTLIENQGRKIMYGLLASALIRDIKGKNA